MSSICARPILQYNRVGIEPNVIQTFHSYSDIGYHLYWTSVLNEFYVILIQIWCRKLVTIQPLCLMRATLIHLSYIGIIYEARDNT